MIQAIGMSEKQLVRMMQLEGLFYTAGTLLVSLGLESLCRIWCLPVRKDTGTGC